MMRPYYDTTEVIVLPMNNTCSLESMRTLASTLAAVLSALDTGTSLPWGPQQTESARETLKRSGIQLATEAEILAGQLRLKSNAFPIAHVSRRGHSIAVYLVNAQTTDGPDFRKNKGAGMRPA